MMLCSVSRTKEKEDSEYSTQPWIQSLPQCVHSEVGPGSTWCWRGPHSTGDTQPQSYILINVLSFFPFFLHVTMCNLFVFMMNIYSKTGSEFTFQFMLIRLRQKAGSHHVPRRSRRLVILTVCYWIAGQKPGECEPAVSGRPGRQWAHQQNQSRGKPPPWSRSVHFLFFYFFYCGSSLNPSTGIFVDLLIFSVLSNMLVETLNISSIVSLTGNINQSLMTLRTCMEVLRENQMCGTNKVDILLLLHFT